MKTNLTKEQALKALLLVALAGNQAMWIAGRPASDSHEAAELASAGEAVKSTSTVNSVSNSPLSVSPNALVLGNAIKPQVERVPIITRGTTKAAPSTHVKRYTGKIRICEVPLHVLFEEVSVNGQKKTQITLSDLEAKDAKFTTTFALIGTPAELGITAEAPNEKAKKEVDREIAETGRRELEKANRCGAPEDAIEVSQGEEPAPRPKRVARRSRGGGKNLEMVRRSISRIAAFGDVSDENEARGRAKNERELERLIKSDLYPSLKALLMAKDEDAEKAMDALDEAIEELEALGSDGSIDNRRITRLAGTLKGLKYGVETHRRVADFSEEARALKEDFQNARSQGGQILPEQYQQYQELQARMQQEIVMGPFAQLSQYRGYMTKTDIDVFTLPYQNLQREMQTIVGGPGVPGGLPGQIANVPGAVPGPIGGGLPGQIANVPGVGGGFGAPIPLNTVGGMPGQIANVPGSPFNFPGANPGLLNTGGGFGAPIPMGAVANVPQPILSQPPFLQSGLVANVPGPVLGAPIGGSPIFPNAPLPIGSPIVPPPPTPFTAPVPTINRAPLVATNSFGYGSPSPFLMNQPSLFSSTIAQPQIYANTLPAQSVVSPAMGPGSLGAYANFSLNFGAPSIFSTPVGPYIR